MNAARAFSTPIYNDGLRLAGLWLPSSEMTKIQNSPQEKATLPGLESCATAHGAPAGSVTSYSTFTNWISGLSDGPASSGATPAQLRRINHQLAPIFVRCAGPYIRVQDKLELAQQVIFLKQHEKQVQALEALTRRVIGRQQRQDGVPMTW